MNTFKIYATKDLYGRNAVTFVQTLNQIKASIYLEKEGRSINLKSVLGLMSAGVKAGEELTISVYEDTNIDIDYIKNIINTFFEQD